MPNGNNDIFDNLPLELIQHIKEYIPRDRDKKSPSSDCIRQMVSDFESQWDGQIKWSLQSLFGVREEMKRLRMEELERLFEVGGEEEEDDYFWDEEEDSLGSSEE